MNSNINNTHPSVPAQSTPTTPSTSTVRRQRKIPEIHYCPFCDKGFDRKYNLKVHKRKHTGEKPYGCPVLSCSERFSWRSSMAHHVRSRHGPSVFVNAGLPVANLVNEQASVPVSMASQGERQNFKPLERIVKPMARRGERKKDVKKMSHVELMLPAPISPAANTAEKHPSTARELLVDSDGANMKQPLQAPQFKATIPCGRDLICEEFPCFIPDVFLDTYPTDAMETEDPALEFISDLLLLESADTTVDAELIALVGSGELLGDSIDDCDLYLVPTSDDITDAEMEFLAKNPGHLPLPALSVDSQPLPIHSPFEF